MYGALLLNIQVPGSYDAAPRSRAVLSTRFTLHLTPMPTKRLRNRSLCIDVDLDRTKNVWDPDLSPSSVTGAYLQSRNPSGLAFCTQPGEEVLTDSLDLMDYTNAQGMIYL